MRKWSSWLLSGLLVATGLQVRGYVVVTLPAKAEHQRDES